MEKARHKKKPNIRSKFSILSVLHGYIFEICGSWLEISRNHIFSTLSCEHGFDKGKCSFAKWSQWAFCTSKVFQSRRLEDFSPKSLRARLLEACLRQRCDAWSWRVLRVSRTWRSSHSCCTSTKVGGSKRLFCLVVLWRQYRDHLG